MLGRTPPIPTQTGEDKVSDVDGRTLPRARPE